MAAYYSRNTPTEHLCPKCKGAGELVKNNSWNQDPQHDVQVPCTNSLCMDGWVRWAHIDPLELLERARAARRRSPAHAVRYGEIRQRVVSPVYLTELGI